MRVEVKFPGDSPTDNQTEMFKNLKKGKDYTVMNVEEDCVCN
jgi:hypothetical protein